MQPAASYDLITLEPPPIAFAGVAALYSREFYALARTRLTQGGYVSQWLPAYQVPPAVTLAMIRAFVDVFPQSVLASGALGELLLLGTNDSRIEIDPARIAGVVSRSPRLLADLQRVDLDRPHEIVGTFVGSAARLAGATQHSPAVTDDRPMQEYSVGSRLGIGMAVPASVFDLRQVAAWCPTCYVDGRPAPLVDGLDTYLALLELAYAAPADANRTAILAREGTRQIAGSAYLGTVVPESADVHGIVGTALAARNRFDDAVVEFREGLRLAPDSAVMHRHLGAALIAWGQRDEGLRHLRRSVELDPANAETRYQVATILLDANYHADAIEEFRAALRLIPNSVEVHNSLGVALASVGRLDEAIAQFEEALAHHPAHADAQRNLASLKGRRPPRVESGAR
jgi:tetratricopeptide (TPR) repeat protein